MHRYGGHCPDRTAAVDRSTNAPPEKRKQRLASATTSCPSLAFAAAAAALAGLVAVSSAAGAVDSRVRSACSGDYHRFCPNYQVDTPQLRSCMKAAGKRLSPGCVDALVDAGEISRKELNRRR